MFSRLAAISLLLCILGVSGFLQSATGVARIDTNNPLNTITVNSTADAIADDGRCTLREAITVVNTGEPSGILSGECLPPEGLPVVELPAGRYLLTLVGSGEDGNGIGDLDINHPDVTLRGAGVAQTIIDGNGTDRVLDVRQGLTVEDLTITNGRAPDGASGGGIRHWDNPEPAAPPKLILRRVAVRNNQASVGGGVYFRVANRLTEFTLEYSEISENYANHGGGLWISHNARPAHTMLRMSTISGNQIATGGQGAGLWNNIKNYFTMYGMTITDNWVGDGTSGIGGGVYSEGDRQLYTRGSLIANNHAATGTDCVGNVLSSGGNLVGNPSDCGFEAGEWDQINIDPRLEPLQLNGGYGTRTHALFDDSPALDQGWCIDTTTDQRGASRPTDILTIPNGISACDVGAYESLVLAGTPTNTPTNTPTFTGTPTHTPTVTPTRTPTALPTADILVNSTADELADDGYCTLREAIIAANEEQPSGTTVGECAAGNGVDTIVLPAGHFLLTRTGQREDVSREGDLDIRSSMRLLGAGGYETIVDAQGIDRVIEIHTGTVSIEGFAVVGGYAPDGVLNEGEPEAGGGILIPGNANGSGVADVTIADMVIRNNRATNGASVNAPTDFGEKLGRGGGIALLMGSTLTVRNTRIEGNYSGMGGAIYLGYATSATIEDSTIISNFLGVTSNVGDFGYGDGLYAVTDVTIRGTVFADHRLAISAANATIENSTIVGNEIGIFVGTALDATGITVAYNRVGIRTLNLAVLGNSIVDQNEIHCESGTVVSYGYNLFGSGFGCPIYGEADGNQIGVDARLAPLADNGGRTYTLALLPDSPALDAGRCFDLGTDQRGVPRPSDLPYIVNADDGCDIGAYEEQAPIPTVTPTSTIVPSHTATPTVVSNTQSRLYLPLVER